MVRKPMGSVDASGADLDVRGLLSFDLEVNSRMLILGPGNIVLSWLDSSGDSK